MNQPSLFDDDSVPERAPLSVVLSAAAGGNAALGRVQKQFSKLLAKIDAQRLELAEWNAFVPVFMKRISAEVHPLQKRFCERRMAMVQLLDRAMDDKSLGKSHRAKMQNILMALLTELLDASRDPEVIRLHDKYADISFADEQQEDMELMQAIAAGAFGVELGDDHGAATPEDLQRLIAEKIQVAQAENIEKATAEANDAEHASPRRPGRPRSAKAIASDAQRELAAKSASQAVREIYRKLASELHPDRENDPVERERKTALMKQVNQAYEARDLLTLLELQLSVQQVDTAALANMAEDRLIHYNALLREQSQRLQQELAEVIEPFAAQLGGRAQRQFGVDLVQRSLDADIRELKEGIRSIDEDLLRFEDIRQLKASLKHYRIETHGDDDFDIVASALFEARAPAGRRRR